MDLFKISGSVGSRRLAPALAGRRCRWSDTSEGQNWGSAILCVADQSRCPPSEPLFLSLLFPPEALCDERASILFDPGKSRRASRCRTDRNSHPPPNLFCYIQNLFGNQVRFLQEASAELTGEVDSLSGVWALSGERKRLQVAGGRGLGEETAGEISRGLRRLWRTGVARAAPWHLLCWLQPPPRLGGIAVISGARLPTRVGPFLL